MEYTISPFRKDLGLELVLFLWTLKRLNIIFVNFLYGDAVKGWIEVYTRFEGSVLAREESGKEVTLILP